MVNALWLIMDVDKCGNIKYCVEGVTGIKVPKNLECLKGHGTELFRCPFGVTVLLEVFSDDWISCNSNVTIIDQVCEKSAPSIFPNQCLTL